MKLVVDPAPESSKAGETVQDTCAGSLPTVKTCLQLPEDRTFVCREKGFECFQDTLASFLKIYAKQALHHY